MEIADYALILTAIDSILRDEQNVDCYRGAHTYCLRE
jgi:hypothetical protein